MKKLFDIIFLFQAGFLVMTITGYSQLRTADISIENAQVENDSFSFEIHITPTNDWGAGNRKALGDCSWYFDYNTNALASPMLSFVAPEVDPNAGYTNTVEIVGPKLGVTTDLDAANFDGVSLTEGVNYHLYTVKMLIPNSSQTSDLYWDQVNTAVFNARDNLITVTYIGDGDISLGPPVSIHNDGNSPVLPEHFKLHPNYPNPFNPETTIRFEIPGNFPEYPTIQLVIYDTLGRAVRKLYSGRISPGIYEMRWDSRNSSDKTLASGIYLVRLEAQHFSQTQKMILLR